MNVDGFGVNLGLPERGSVDGCSGSGNVLVLREVGVFDGGQVAGGSGLGEAEQVADAAYVAAGGMDLAQGPAGSTNPKLIETARVSQS